MVLCLHNKIPILEWYRNARKVSGHEPNCLRDLIDGKAIAIEYNTFAIFFDDEQRDPLQFMTENTTQRDEWIAAINKVRIEHRSFFSDDPISSHSDDIESNEYCRITPAPIPEDTSTLPIDCSPQNTNNELGLPHAKSFSSASPISFFNRESGIGLSTSNSDGMFLFWVQKHLVKVGFT